MIVLDTNVVAVSLPSIARSFHVGFADVEWVVSAYMVAFASCLLAAGGLADRFGRKKLMMLGLGVFCLASLGCGLAPTALSLNLARAVKGVGAAMLLTAALAVIANTFQEGPGRARAWAVWGMCMGLATTSGQRAARRRAPFCRRPNEDSVSKHLCAVDHSPLGDFFNAASAANGCAPAWSLVAASKTAPGLRG